MATDEATVMERNVHFTATASGQYGALEPNFQYDLREGYSALVGPNNAGKSSILQLIYRHAMGEDAFREGRVCIVRPDRAYIEPSTQPGGGTLASWNLEFVENVRGAPLPYASSAPGPSVAQLMRVLMHGDLLRQAAELNDLLARVGLPTFVLGAGQQITFESIMVHFQGSGLRGALPILAALTNPDVTLLVIDEPELSLEPRLQKVLRDVLIEAAEQKTILLSTHSHLFLDRRRIDANQVVTREGGGTRVETLATREQLFDVTFDLLGSSTEDLFFPRNYVVVEGASDQVITERVLDLLGVPPPRIKVLAARGVDAVRDAAESVVRALVPLVVRDSPYANRVIAIIDQPNDPNHPNVERLRRDLHDRLYELDKPTIEDYIPEAMYERAGRAKGADLARIAELRGDYAAQRALKKEISTAIGDALTPEDLDTVAVIRDACQRAIDESAE